jgi:uncharacterized membrane protein YcaP (DUF421 family)
MDLVLRAVAVFVFVFVLTRVIGRRELSSLQPFDLILLIVLGDALQQGLTQDDYSVTGAVLVVGTLALLQVFVSWVNWRFPRARGFIEGEPVIVVEDGRPIERNLRRERITVKDIEEEARAAQISSLGELEWAILEDDGHISCIPRSKGD